MKKEFEDNLVRDNLELVFQNERNASSIYQQNFNLFKTLALMTSFFWLVSRYVSNLSTPSYFFLPLVLVSIVLSLVVCVKAFVLFKQSLALTMQRVKIVNQFGTTQDCVDFDILNKDKKVMLVYTALSSALAFLVVILVHNSTYLFSKSLPSLAEMVVILIFLFVALRYLRDLKDKQEKTDTFLHSMSAKLTEPESNFYDGEGTYSDYVFNHKDLV